MSWNHRVIKKQFKNPLSGDTEEEFNIHEVYYNERNTDIVGWTENPISPYGETIDDLKQTLEWMLAALHKPTLEEFVHEDGRIVLKEVQDCNNCQNCNCNKGEK